MSIQHWFRGLSVSERARFLESASSQLHVTRGAVRHWINGTRRIPAERVLDLEAITQHRVLRSELRPDLYPPDRSRPRSQTPSLKRAGVTV